MSYNITGTTITLTRGDTLQRAKAPVCAFWTV